MPGALGPLHVNGRSGEADLQGLHEKGEEGVMLLTSQAGLLPVSCQRITTWTETGKVMGR